MESKTRLDREQIILTCIVGIGVALLVVSDQGVRWEGLRWLKAVHDYVLSTMLVIMAVFNIRAWIERKFWFPTYVHVLAIFSYVIFLLALGAFDVKRWIFTLVLPCLVYGAFVVYGGVEAAAQRRDRDISERSRRESERGNLIPR